MTLGKGSELQLPVNQVTMKVNTNTLRTILVPNDCSGFHFQHSIQYITWKSMPYYNIGFMLNDFAQLLTYASVPNTVKVDQPKLWYEVGFGVLNVFSTYGIFNLQWIYWDIAPL